MKTDDEIYDIIDLVNAIESNRYPGMTYEQGVDDALHWILGDTEDEEFIESFKK